MTFLPSCRWFYASINIGALVSMVLSPQIKAMGCLGEETCYVWAFGVPAILMVFSVRKSSCDSTWQCCSFLHCSPSPASLVFFAAGWPVYTMVQPRRNVFCRFFGTICVSVHDFINSWKLVS